MADLSGISKQHTPAHGVSRQHKSCPLLGHLEQEEEVFDVTTLRKFTLTSMLLGGSLHASQPAVPVTVFVHGTTFILGQITYKPEGLCHFNRLPKLNLAYKFGLELARGDSLNFPLSDFYAFGWRGELDFQRREQAASELAEALLQLVSDYQKRGQRIKITLITHSHGGAVALNLAQVVERLTPDQRAKLVIECLILLACPVQVKTQDYVHHPIFSKIYALYSKVDLVQRAAPQLSELAGQLERGERPGSGQIFPFNLRLKQAAIRTHWRPGIMHLEFIHPSFAYKLPKIMQRLDWYAANAPTQAFLQGQLSLDLATL